MTSSANMNDRRRDRWLPLLLLAALLAGSIYIGAYIVMCRKVVESASSTVVYRHAGVSAVDLDVENTIRYELPPILNTQPAQRVCQRIFWPIYAFDRRVRPKFWTDFDLLTALEHMED